MRIYSIRHGHTNYNVNHILNDDPKKDVHLTELGIKQAEDASERLKDKRIDVIFVSEFPRTKQTAEIINRHHNAPIKVDPRLNERKSGLDGRPHDEFERTVSRDRFHIRPENGESWQDEKKRVFSFMEYLKKMNYGSVLIVNHGDNMLMIEGYFKRLSDQEMWDLPYPDNCEIMEYET